MKVKPTNKKLWKSFGGYVSIINTALSLILMFVSVPDNSALKIWLAAIFVVVLIALFCFVALQYILDSEEKKDET